MTGVGLCRLIWSRLPSPILKTFCLALAIAAGSARESRGQDNLESLLRAGEIPAAIAVARNAPDSATRDAMLARIARRQQEMGAGAAALQTASVVASRPVRNAVFAQMLGNGPGMGDFGGPGGGQGPGAGFGSGLGPMAGQGGGITLQDFQPLINLIQQTISSDSWTGTGNGDGTILPYLAGVWVDPSATMHRIRREDGTFREARRSGRRSVSESGVERHVSLVQLEREARRCLLTGQQLGDEYRLLGGLYEIESVVVLPTVGDLVLVGRGGPWELDEMGRTVNIATGRPVLQLDDLVAVLRAVQRGDGGFGCTITPRKENLAAMQQFLATSRLGGAAWVQGVRDAVGLQDVDVFGIDRTSRAARILVDADHHMKLVGMGIEPSVEGVPSYFGNQVAAFDGRPMAMDVARWWFTLGDFSVAASDDDRAWTLRGPLVQVLSETEMIDRQGERIHTGRAVGPTAAFARDFTTHFDAMADRYPVYHELRNIFSLAVVCALIDQQGLDQRIDWDWGCFAESVPVATGAEQGLSAWPVARLPAPQTVESVMNFHELRQREGNRTLKHTLAGVSGGVGCYAPAQLRRTRPRKGTVTFGPAMFAGVNDADAWQFGRPALWSDVR